MAAVVYSKGTRTANLLGSVANSLANNAESATVTYNAATGLFLYAAVIVKLGSLTPTAGGHLLLRVTVDDGVDVADKIGGDVYPLAMTSGASAKVLCAPRISLYPFSMRMSLVNFSGVALPGSGNEMYLTPYTESA